ncbi:hypothetical protein ACQ3G6_06025 [Allorhizobium undicola]|uniref:hypothetical protein n=1 Tax=Allorhizobium undicola TaxID=78527 RepID=UPI0012B5363F|nr:hypothetical protein [Allorhizobium undicola]
MSLKGCQYGFFGASCKVLPPPKERLRGDVLPQIAAKTLNRLINPIFYGVLPASAPEGAAFCCNIMRCGDRVVKLKTMFANQRGLS